MRFFGLRLKLGVAFTALAVVPVAGATFLGLCMIESSLMAATAREIEAELASNAAHMEAWLEILGNDLGWLSRTTELLLAEGSGTPLPWAEVSSVYTDFAARRPDVYQVRLLDGTGMERVRVNRTLGGDPLVESRERLQDKASRYYVREILAAPAGQTWISPVDLNIEGGVQEDPPVPVFRIARRLDLPGEDAGFFVTLNVFAEPMLRRVEPLRWRDDIRVVLAGKSGWTFEASCGAPSCGAPFWPTDSPSAATKAPAPAEARIQEVAGGFTSSATIRPPGAGEAWRVHLWRPRELVVGATRRLSSRLWLVTGLIGMLSGALALVAADSLSRPLLKILAYVGGVERREAPATPSVRTRDEIEQVAHGVTRMAESLTQAEAELRDLNSHLEDEVRRRVGEVERLHQVRREQEHAIQRADRLASLGVLSASLAHEVGNPLAGMRAALQVQLRRLSPDGEGREALAAIVAQVDHLTEILDRVRGFARPQLAQGASVTPAQAARRVLALVEGEAAARQVHTAVRGTALHTPIQVPETALEQVLMNLILNAVQSLDGGGHVEVVAEHEGSGIRLAVTDDGPGIPEGVMERIFEPFFSLKPHGTGLGLAIARQLAVEELGGSLTIGSSPGRGTTATLFIPLDGNTP